MMALKVLLVSDRSPMICSRALAGMLSSAAPQMTSAGAFTPWMLSPGQLAAHVEAGHAELLRLHIIPASQIAGRLDDLIDRLLLVERH